MLNRQGCHNSGDPITVVPELKRYVRNSRTSYINYKQQRLDFLDFSDKGGKRRSGLTALHLSGSCWRWKNPYHCSERAGDVDPLVWPTSSLLGGLSVRTHLKLEPRSVVSLRTTDVFQVVASLPPKNSFSRRVKLKPKSPDALELLCCMLRTI